MSNRIIYSVFKTKAEAIKEMTKMIQSGEINEMEFPFVAERSESMFRDDIRRPWAIWISP